MTLVVLLASVWLQEETDFRRANKLQDNNMRLCTMACAKREEGGLGGGRVPASFNGRGRGGEVSVFICTTLLLDLSLTMPQKAMLDILIFLGENTHTTPLPLSLHSHSTNPQTNQPPH